MPLVPAVAPADDVGEDDDAVDGEDDELGDDELGEDDEDDDELLPLFALVRTNDSAPEREVELVEPDVADDEPLPDVPTAPVM